METPIAQRYIIVNKLDSPANVHHLIPPSWERDGGDAVCIIDLQTGMWTDAYYWPDGQEKPEWQILEEDRL
jgi:hypothetical protein